MIWRQRVRELCRALPHKQRGGEGIIINGAPDLRQTGCRSSVGLKKYLSK